MPTDNVSRRGFLKASGTTALAGSALTALPAASARAARANERIRIGFIGPGGRGFGAHVKTLARLKNDGYNIELVAVADVYTVHQDRAADYIEKENGNKVTKYVDYREMIEKEELDAVAIGTPDHWHAKQILDCLAAGLHVYCEKPMTKQVEEAVEVAQAWEKSGLVMQVGVQGTSQPVWNTAREMLNEGKLGKVMMYQTEYFRNSSMGQWRYYALKKEMTPKTIDWKRWLGVEEGLSEDMPFDREKYAQWRRFWPFGSGMYTDLFVHRVTMMLKATGLGYPGRVVGAGGLYLEYDGRGVPDVATVAADYPEGVHGLVSSTMCNEETRLRQVIRGHFGSFVFSGDNIEYVPERPQVTRDSKLKAETIKAEPCPDHNYAHFQNWVEAIEARDPRMCNNPPDLGAAAVTTVILGARSYREGRAFHFDLEKGPHDADASWAQRWEAISEKRGEPKHIPGWKAGDHGSKLEEPSYMSLAGPWINGEPPSNA
ncbi:Inositol 2-dehydrogenase [Maioricimonas rarisocia]|uniref:Inositol 2-dehydrogenase n=1 Tax=Maioricimonas rarisocia TaxID=2528026 RepID=A0A517Z9W6_9PLAN|nr:Gfo/Idh/MocA family oxidoreductase [Maioricimonas rarisocia]QDU39287.1 Inositol 2-dehydrogenase [Maioricimonas rarisocia]